MIFNMKNLAGNLPDTFAQDKKSDNYKLLDMARKSADRMDGERAEILKARSIDTAYGHSLDVIGQTFGIERGGRSDEAFRIYVKAAIAFSLCTGEYDSIRECLAALFDCTPGDIQLRDGENSGNVEIVKMPYERFVSAGLSSGEILKIIKGLLPCGVSISNVVMQGTFSYSTAGSEQYPQKGYNAGTYGGYIKYGG